MKRTNGVSDSTRQPQGSLADSVVEDCTQLCTLLLLCMETLVSQLHAGSRLAALSPKGIGSEQPLNAR